MIRAHALIVAFLALWLSVAVAAEPTWRAAVPSALDTYVFIGGGSGVLISADGLVLTNNHVIAGEAKLRVRRRDGLSVPAKLLGTDPVGDIALLQATFPGPVPYARFADAANARAGATVFAIGNPFGLGDLDDQPTVTAGVLSTGRIVREDYTDALMGDAPVNPGNSGGPLFDAAGLLLGINGQIRSRSGFRINSGIGLAISSVQLQAFMPLLRTADGGYVRHTAEPIGLELKDGTELVEVSKAVAPFMLGDRLVTIAHRNAVSADTARGLFASLPWTPDATVPVTLIRGGQTLTLSAPAGRTPVPGRVYHGLFVREADVGVLIDSVNDDSPAAKAGLVRGERVRRANERDVNTRGDWLRALIGLEIGDVLVLDVLRKDGTDAIIRLALIPQP